MKVEWRSPGKSLGKITLLALVGCLAAVSPASAQEIVGKFTLPYQVRWGHTLLQAGTYDYSIEALRLQSVTSIQASGEPVLVMVRGAQGGPATLLLAMASQRAEESDGSGLTFLLENGERMLRSLSLNNFGIVVRFMMPKSSGELSAKKARKLPTVASAAASD